MMERLMLEQNSDAVVLLHGLGRGAWSMNPLAKRLVQAGYRVFNLGYPRRADSIETIVTEVEQAINECGALNCNQVHFVTHSFGGLVLRAYLSKYNPDSIGPVSYTHLRAHETRHDLVCRLLLETKK